jgi:hypothetical protein
MVRARLAHFPPFANSAIAWVLGATDPISGTAALHEVVRGYGALLRAGWKPLRTSTYRRIVSVHLGAGLILDE